MPEFEIDGRPVFYREAGPEGAPTVLLAHCSLAHSGMWKPIIAALAETRHVVALDLPAHGRTAPPPEGESLQLYAMRVCQALIDRVGKPAHLVGLSLGGATVGRLAVRTPDYARSVTLIEPVWFFLLDENDRPEKAVEEEVMREVLAATKRKDYATAIRHFIETWGAPGAVEGLGEAGRAYAARVFPYIAADLSMTHGHPPGQLTGAEIAGMVPPTLLMAGSETVASALAVVEEIKLRIPSARMKVIEGAGHLAPVTHWREVLAELTGFFDAVEAAG